MSGEFNPETKLIYDFPVYDFENSRFISVGTLCKVEDRVGIVTARDDNGCGEGVWADICFSYDQTVPEKCVNCMLSSTCPISTNSGKFTDHNIREFLKNS